MGVDNLINLAKRKKAVHKKDVIGKPEFVEVAPPPISKELKRLWSYFIRKVYKTDPHSRLTRPFCLEMRPG